METYGQLASKLMNEYIQKVAQRHGLAYPQALLKIAAEDAVLVRSWLRLKNSNVELPENRKENENEYR